MAAVSFRRRANALAILSGDARPPEPRGNGSRRVGAPHAVPLRRQHARCTLHPSTMKLINSHHPRLNSRQLKVRKVSLPSLLLAFILVLLSGGWTNASATTIVVARSAREIVMGADSKVTDTYGNEIAGQVCKIQQFGNLFVAFEGLLRDKATGFSVPDIVRRA